MCGRAASAAEIRSLGTRSVVLRVHAASVNAVAAAPAMNARRLTRLGPETLSVTARPPPSAMTVRREQCECRGNRRHPEGGDHQRHNHPADPPRAGAERTVAQRHGHHLPSVFTMQRAANGIRVGSVKICSRPVPSCRGGPVVGSPRGTMRVMKRNPDRGVAGYRALVVDDEVPLATVVASYLEREQFEVSVAHNGHDAVAMAREIDPDVVVLDLALPGIDGLEACRQLRTFSDAYVVMLTARDTEMDTIIGLSVGADDYVTKPFSPRELVARIRAMLRRPRTVSTPTGTDAAADHPPPRVFGPLRIDVAAREAFIEDQPITLTRTEFDVLAALSARPGVVLSRRQLLDAVWAESWGGNEHLVDVHIGHLRRKLGDDPAAPRYVITVRGVGYRMGSGK